MHRLNIALPLLLGCTTAQAVELMTWERLPLAIPLQVDQERILFIDQNVRVGVPRSLGEPPPYPEHRGHADRRASAPIEPTRLHLQDVHSGEIILIDIAATDAQGQPALEPVKIVRGAHTPKRYGEGPEMAGETAQADGSTSEPAPMDTPPRETPLPVVLTRYAAQNLYAPLRTVEPLPGVVPIKRQRDLDLTGLMPTQPVTAHLLGAWQLDDHTVSAVKLHNTASTALHLDPRALQGDFVSAAFQHPGLGPNGQATDTTVVYLVTRGRGLAASVSPALSQRGPGAHRPDTVGGAHAQ